jgi:hypothetical protein
MNIQVPQRCPFEGEGGGEWCTCPEGCCVAQKNSNTLLVERVLRSQLSDRFQESELPTGVYQFP